MIGLELLLSFIIRPSMAASSHRKPACCDSSGAQDRDKVNKQKFASFILSGPWVKFS
jgi:hypothetical protein